MFIFHIWSHITLKTACQTRVLAATCCHSSVNQSKNFISNKCHCVLAQQRRSPMKVCCCRCLKQCVEFQKITRTSTNLLKLFLLKLHELNKTANPTGEIRTHSFWNKVIWIEIFPQWIYRKLPVSTKGPHSSKNIKIHSPQKGIWLPTVATRAPEALQSVSSTLLWVNDTVFETQLS